MSSAAKVRVSIIGTAGRKEDARKMNRALFHRMVETAQEIITGTFRLKNSDVVLVSGGSAWADHVAVRLWLESAAAASTEEEEEEQPLPEEEEEDGGGLLFMPDSATGATLNELHRAFSAAMAGGFHSRADLLRAWALGAELDCVHPGFLNRNLQIAKSEYVIAFTWGDSPRQPKEGGTKHTWDHCAHATKKVHVPLRSFFLRQQRWWQGPPPSAPTTTEVDSVVCET